jgi:hypothetical protein
LKDSGKTGSRYIEVATGNLRHHVIWWRQVIDPSPAVTKRGCLKNRLVFFRVRWQ